MNKLYVAKETGNVSEHHFRKDPGPKVGPQYGGPWGPMTQGEGYARLPGGGVLQFDLSKLTLADYRAMRTHYQINSSLSVLTFMLHQIDWHLECDDQRIADALEEDLRRVWTRMIRALSQAFWAGYSPVVMEFENDMTTGRVVIDKFKDLVPEDCTVNWKDVTVNHGPFNTSEKIYVYDGINHFGSNSDPIPPEYTLWYGLLQENGDMYGKKLLKPAFPSWFFSQIIHLFANRYFERYGEPIPVGRAPFDQDVDMGNATVSGKQAMESVLQMLRNRSVVVLPSDRDPNTNEYEYDIKYLEGQMRGADWERYLDRLDEEMSLGLFTPVLLFRTAESGSYNLGVNHMQVFMFMLNALAADIKEVIDRYVLERLKAWNFSPKAPRVQWVHRPMGRENVETVRSIITEMIRQGSASVDTTELGEILGLTVNEVQQLAEEPTPTTPGTEVRTDERIGRPERSPRSAPRGIGEARDTQREINMRVRAQVEKAFRTGSLKNLNLSIGHERQLASALEVEGADPETAKELTTSLHGRIHTWVDDVRDNGVEMFGSPDSFMTCFENLLDHELSALAE